MDNSSRCTRQIIRNSRDAFVKITPTQIEMDSLDLLTDDWSNQQAVLLDTIWHHLAPWSTFTGHLFPSASTNKLEFKQTSKKLSKTVSDV